MKIAVPFLVRLHAHHGEDWAEDLVAVAVHADLDVVDEAGPQEEAAALAVEWMLATVDHDRGALGGGRLEVRRDLVPMLPRDEGTHLGRRIVAGSHLRLRVVEAGPDHRHAGHRLEPGKLGIALDRLQTLGDVGRHRGIDDPAIAAVLYK